MLFENTNSYTERTPVVMDQADLFGDDCEINLESENIPLSQLCLNLLEDSEPTIINFIDDYSLFHNNYGRNHLAPVSFQSVPSNFKVIIGEFEKRGDGLNAYIVYKLETKVNDVVGYTKKQYETWHRFSDFLGLHGKIVEKYQAKGIVIPQPPKKNISALTYIETNSDPTMSRKVGVQRARQLQRFISRLIQHPILRSDCDVRDFLTIDADLPEVVETATLSSFGVMKFFTDFHDVFSKMSFHMEEGDRWFMEAQIRIEDLEKTLLKLYSNTEALVAARKEMASDGEEMNKALSMISLSEEPSSLSRDISALTGTTGSVSTPWGIQAKYESEKFSNPIYEYIMLISALKDKFEKRVRAWQSWKDAEQTLADKRDRKTMYNFFGNVEKSFKLKMEIEETVQTMNLLKKHLKELNKDIRKEVSRYESNCKDDIKQMLVEYMETFYSTHAEMLHQWEKLEPIAQNIQD